MLQTKNGEWWIVILQDRDPIGRLPHLLPVTWVYGSPMLGKKNGKGYATGKKN